MWKILVLGMGKSNSLIRKKGGIPRTGKGIGFGGGGFLRALDTSLLCGHVQGSQGKCRAKQMSLCCASL